MWWLAETLHVQARAEQRFGDRTAVAGLLDQALDLAREQGARDRRTDRGDDGSCIFRLMATIAVIPYQPWRHRGFVVDGAFRWRLGTRPLDVADWIEFDTDADGDDGWVAEKATIMREHADTAFAVIDGIEPDCQEIADALIDHLRRRFPDRFDGIELDRSLHPLDAAARLVPDDLVVMVERDGELIFGGGSVCFPNRWDLRSKLGRSMSAVHAPVAQLNEQLEQAVDSFFDRTRARAIVLAPGLGHPRHGGRVRPARRHRRPTAGAADDRRLCTSGSNARRSAASRGLGPCCSRSGPTSRR
ncbi:MAG: DUF3445 domain-containing protein [Ilumatobacteraceae bacterium]